MITPGDEYPLHQSARPVRDPGTDRNAYDRFFFNGYSRDGSLFFAVALGLYPGRDVMDAAFSVSLDGTQHNLRASRRLGADRLDTRVGPVAVRIIEPLRALAVEVDDREPGSAGSGLRASLVWRCRGPVFEEPGYHWKPGHRTLMDVTRMTQNGTWSGVLEVAGRPIELDDAATWGTRDRSWGTRPVGEREAPGAPEGTPSFYWLWAPLNFEDSCVLFDVNEDSTGVPWHSSAMTAPAGGLDSPVTVAVPSYRLEHAPGTRHAASAAIQLEAAGKTTTYSLAPLFTFFMGGIGYAHPTWGHGTWQGEEATACETLDLGTVDETDPFLQHVQALCRATRSDGAEGMGVLEQLVIGPHGPSGFTELLDMAR